MKRGATSAASPGDELSALVRKASAATVKITYSQGGETVTVALDGKGRSLYVEGDTSVYVVGKNAISCRSQGAAATCKRDPLAYAATADHFETILAGLATYSTTASGEHLSNDRIAGRAAKCVTFHASDFPNFDVLAGSVEYEPTDTATVCLDEGTGYLLRVSVRSTAGNGLFEATHFADPSPQDFVPPAAPKGAKSYPGLPTPNP